MTEKAIQYMQELIAVGVDKEQAKVMANYMERLSVPIQSDIVTKLEFKSELKGLENTLIKWMIGTAIGILIVVFTVMEFRVTGIERSIDQRMTSLDQRMTSIEKSIDQRMTSIEKSIDQNRQAIDQNRQAIDQIQASIQKLIELHLEQAKSK